MTSPPPDTNLDRPFRNIAVYQSSYHFLIADLISLTPFWMYYSSLRASAVSLLTFSSAFLSQQADAGVVRQHDDHGTKLPPYLQSDWHTKNSPTPKMTADEAMEYYFPHMKRTMACSPTAGDGGNGTTPIDPPNPPPGIGGNGTDSGGQVPEPIPGNWSIRNYNTVSSVYNLTVYPRNLPLFLNQTDIGLPFFDVNVTGRVTPLGDFSGYEDSIEYFWGLAPVPIPPATAAISKAVVTHFTSGCPEVASSTVEFTVTNVVGPFNGTVVTKLKQIAFWRFGANGRIVAYDAWIPNLQNFVGKITYPDIKTFMGGAYTPNTTDVLFTAQQICGTQAQFCTGGNQVYASVEDCIGTLMQKPFGIYDEAWGDNVVCRRVHVLLTPLRPAVSLNVIS